VIKSINKFLRFSAVDIVHVLQVSIFGDGTSAATMVRNNNDYEQLVKYGSDAAVTTDIKSSFNCLKDKIAT